MRAGVIGLGIMGGTFAGHLATEGVVTFGYDILAATVAELTTKGVHGRTSPLAVAMEADVLISSLPHAAALEDALFADTGIAAAGRPGLVVVETSTLSLETKEQARGRLAEMGIAMLDAPVSGTGAQAQSKDITIFASGEQTDFERVHKLLAHFARSVRFVGAFGTGSKIKYIANLLVAIHTLAAAEALVLGEKAGLDPAMLLDLLTGSAATSRMLELRGPSMVTNAYSHPMMKVDVFQKDLDLIQVFAAQCGCPVPLFDASVPFFRAARDQGMGAYDTAAVVSVLRGMAKS